MLNAMQNWAASRPRLHIWVGALGALPTHMKNRADAGRAIDPNEQKVDEIAIHLGRPVEDALTRPKIDVLVEGLKRPNRTYGNFAACHDHARRAPWSPLFAASFCVR